MRRTDRDTTVMDELFDAVMLQAESDPNTEEWREDWRKLQERLPDELKDAVFHVVWQGIQLHGEVLFKAGWGLRDDPSKVLEVKISA